MRRDAGDSPQEADLPRLAGCCIPWSTLRTRSGVSAGPDTHGRQAPAAAAAVDHRSICSTGPWRGSAPGRTPPGARTRPPVMERENSGDEPPLNCQSDRPSTSTGHVNHCGKVLGTFTRMDYSDGTPFGGGIPSTVTTAVGGGAWHSPVRRGQP